MSYPVILYPKLIVEFRRQHPLPSLNGESVPASALAGAGALPALQMNSSSLRHSVPPTSPNFPSWFVYSSLVFGLLGFNLFVTPRLPSNIQQPVRLVSLFGATVAITFQLRRDIKTLATSSSTQPLVEELAATDRPPAVAPPSLSGNTHTRDERRHLPKQQLLEYLEELKVNLAGQVLQPSGASDAPVGRSEDAFASVLERYFPGRVKRQLEFPIPQSEKGRSFSTDFAVVLDELGLHIDVEIDEPFDLKKKRPTHCIDDYHDRYRNGFFLQGNWIVIRFAEEQIVRYPKSCCREIAVAIARVTGLDRFLKPLEKEPILQPIPQWTKKQARALAKVNYRDTYLPLLSLFSPTSLHEVD